VAKKKIEERTGGGGDPAQKAEDGIVRKYWPKKDARRGRTPAEKKRRRKKRKKNKSRTRLTTNLIGKIEGLKRGRERCGSSRKKRGGLEWLESPPLYQDGGFIQVTEKVRLISA